MNIHSDLLADGHTAIIGIINVTPDSFSDGGEFLDADSAIEHGIHLEQEGADILDVGAESTRPGAKPVSAAEEVRRLEPVVRGLAEYTNAWISVDTTKSTVARKMLDAGAHIINDISALQFDKSMAEVVSAYGCPVVLMHIQGTPRTMQQNPTYDDVIEDILQYFTERVTYARDKGIEPDQIILDPGIGFGKTLEHNYRIINEIARFTELEYPVLLGASRKSFIGQTLDLPVEERLEGSLAVAVLGARAGVRLLRVHDVKETVRAVRMVDAIQNRLKAE
ncbi:MAG: dihydropteroate synthase [Candidatus Marinimicrobia bacterium]|nr:dihydropteroate synthase [Candidatus Neomarinimicrobiota bacterium]MCF7828981.1 dihydropteroate synthase [Candidatus Neomarinimicrobiota bacterium]MCF7879941.1 dihydropteroate synthase [Candidatus Neomarinimicrobiota bacterium]